MDKTLNMIAASLALTSLILGCSAPKPSADYDVSEPIQVTVDLLKGTRHFVETSDYEKSWSEKLLNEQTLAVIKTSKWEQLLLKIELNSEQLYKLERNLSRACWAIKPDAELKIKSQAYRGTDNHNIMTACVSKRLGDQYPLFMYSRVHDRVLGDYLMMLSPTSHYSDQPYLCKAKTEGYDLTSNLYCI
jgi:hypothetical protein